MKLTLLFPVAVVVAMTAPASAAKTVDPSGLVGTPIEIRNSGDAPILCQAEIAHWFATDLGRIAPGANGALDLRVDKASGTVAAMNARGEALPVERAWCGLEGRTYETRWDLDLKGNPPQARQLDCRPEGQSLACR